MKKKLNLFCILMLLIQVAFVLIPVVLIIFGESEDDTQYSYSDSLSGFPLFLMFAFVIFFLYIGIRVFVAFIKFILNVNKDKVFIWDNVKLLRRIGWGYLILAFAFIFVCWLNKETWETIFDYNEDTIFFGVFALIMSEVFAIGLKLKEEQDLTI